MGAVEVKKLSKSNVLKRGIRKPPERFEYKEFGFRFMNVSDINKLIQTDF